MKATMNRKAEMGVGTLIIFIALLLVAAVAAVAVMMCVVAAVVHRISVHFSGL